MADMVDDQQAKQTDPAGDDSAIGRTSRFDTFLERINYPATRDEVVKMAHTMGDQDMLRRARQLPDEQFSQPEDLGLALDITE
ncbi:DUF2795 domain-containing protein [Candidatus Microgenomates bacterium]|nr:DUF2795 domain-containing protein [Candidatus Microgenomates bacterium]